MYKEFSKLNGKETNDKRNLGKRFEQTLKTKKKYITVAKKKKITIPSVGEDVHELISHHCWSECKIIQSVQKILLQFLKYLNIHLPLKP